MTKKFDVIKATTREMDGVELDERVPFNASGVFTTEDAGLADEIDKTYGMKGTKEVVVTPYDSATEHGHRYRFGASRTFSAAWEQFEKRRKDKKK